MTSDFKQQLQELIDQAAKTYAKDTSLNENSYIKNHFKQGCEFLIPVLMKAIEQRDQSEKVFGRSCYANDAEVDEGLQELNKELLNILKGEK